MFHNRVLIRTLLATSKLLTRILLITSKLLIRILLTTSRLIINRIQIIREMKMFSSRLLNQSSNQSRHCKEVHRFIVLSVVQ